MRLDKILNAVIPGMYDTPCKIAIFSRCHKVAVILYKANLALNFWTRSFSGIGYWMDQVPSCHSPRKGAVR